jgi:hypothetical protein
VAPPSTRAADVGRKRAAGDDTATIDTEAHLVELVLGADREARCDRGCCIKANATL